MKLTKRGRKWVTVSRDVRGQGFFLMCKMTTYINFTCKNKVESSLNEWDFWKLGYLFP